jgi:hypothetical protein
MDHEGFGVEAAAVAVDAVSEPLADGAGVAADERVAVDAEVGLERLPELRCDHAAVRVGGEAAEGAVGPVVVLQGAAAGVGNVDAEHGARAVVPGGKDVANVERARRR